MEIRRTKQPKLYHFISGIINIIDGLVEILTIGFFYSNFRYRFMKWYMFRNSPE